MGVEIDMIAGVSVGALNGAFIASGAAPDLLESLWRRVQFRDLFGFRLRSLINLRRADSIYDGNRLARFIEKQLPARRFEDLKIPLTVVATDLDSGESLLLEQGDLIKAVLASVAIPGLLPPVDFEGLQLIDGGVSNNLPVDVAMQKGATIILAIRCRCEKTRRKRVHGIVNILSRSFDITDSARYRMQPSTPPRCEMIIVQPCFDFEVGLLDFSHSGELLNMAYTATMEQQSAFTGLIAGQGEAEAAGNINLSVGGIEQYW
jgi:NTE family protein